MDQPAAEARGPDTAAEPRVQASPALAPGPQRPRLVVFDVNETLSDMSSLAARFTEVGLPQQAAPTWFASLLRDGFALTVTGENPSFTDLASQSLRSLLAGQGTPDPGAAVASIMGAFMQLPAQPDVVEGIRLLSDSGMRLVTLSNGSTSVARSLLERHGLLDRFERLLSVEDAPAWKPAEAAYRYALDVCGAKAAEAMLVAVHPWDIHGAHHAGLRTAFVNRTGVLYPGYATQPDVETESLVGLARVLGALSPA